MVRRRTPPASVPSARRRRLLRPQALEVIPVALIGSPPDPGDRVDVGGLRPESLGRAALLGPGGERVERVVADAYLSILLYSAPRPKPAPDCSGRSEDGPEGRSSG